LFKGYIKVNKLSSNEKNFWEDQLRFTDHYKDTDQYSDKSLNLLDRQYANVEHEAVPLLLELHTGLYKFYKLMQLHRNDISDSEENRQQARIAFNALDETQHQINEKLGDISKGTETYKIYESALDYSKQFIHHHVSELEAYEPDSLALSWYYEHQNTNATNNLK